MASSNRHWPSMFKSKPCNNQPWSQHHDNNNNNNSCGRSSNNSPFSSGGPEERSTPEPKPRWNPKPEQIRILEAIFNSGMVNPPRDEIRRIRTQLQEYGHVGDANVFYWFQNRKSRSKNKQRSLQSKTSTTNTSSNTAVTVAGSTVNATSSSSSSSDINSPNNNKTTNNININSNNNIIGGEQFGNSPTSVNQCNNNNYFNQINGFSINSHEPTFFPLHQSGASVIGNNNFSQGLCFGDNSMMNGCDSVHVTPVSNQTVGGFSSLLLGDMFHGGGGGGGVVGGGELKGDEMEKLKFQNDLHELSFLVSTPNNNSGSLLSSSSPMVSTPTSTAISSNLGQFLGEGGGGGGGGIDGKTTVFINGVAIEVPNGAFNVKEEFGEEVMLVHSATGHPVMTNEWGVTLHGLQHGASYYLLVSSPLLHNNKLDSSSDLLASHFPYQI